MRIVVLAFFVACVGACSNDSGGTDASTDASTDAPDAGGCAGDFDCPNASDHCYFPISGGCSTLGICSPFVPSSNCTPTTACGCDGTTISVCAPDGYVDRPATGAGACPPSDAGDDGATEDATDDAADATTD